MQSNDLSSLSVGIFSSLSQEELKALDDCMTVIKCVPGEHIQQTGFNVLLSGDVSVLRENAEIGQMQIGDGFGDWGIWGWMQSRVVMRADSEVQIAHFEEDKLLEAISKEPSLILRIMKNFSRRMDGHLENLSRTLLDTYKAPSQTVRSTLKIMVDGEEKHVRIGTPLANILPKEINGKPVVSGLFNHKHMSLNRPLYLSGSAEGLTGDNLEGRMIYRASISLMALEAAHRIDPKIRLRIGPSIGFAYIFEVDDAHGHSLKELAERLNTEMHALVEADVPFRRDYCSIDEAKARFAAQGWDDAIKLLRKSRNSSVALVSCGEIYAVEIVPLVASTKILDRFCIAENSGELLLYFDNTIVKEAEQRSIHPSSLAKQHDIWLNGIGLTSVGAFNDICIRGDVGKIIQVSEGFHEKRISQLAEMIVQRDKRVKVICIAGPSSSGKTTFLKRLSIQLQVNGLNPKCISLDDYYVNREETVRDENGEYDFEAFEALNIDLLREQLHDLITGKEVKIARYDFQTGISHHHGGPLMNLGESDILLLEGIHGLNPRMPFDQDDGVFRIFINPLTSLQLDNASRVSASDIRLLRRIVRDRHTRAITAASNIMRWPSVRRGEIKHIFPYQSLADAVFNTSLVYEVSVLKVYAERYLLEVDEDDPAQTVAFRLRRLIDKFVSIYPENVPQTSLLREFIGGSAFKY
ncbi:MAG: cyclic nucleotide-binding protein [Proteobacteria bacterium]|nr:cyclic nucleotide-binding protein [Pseudomonadota bacterium]